MITGASTGASTGTDADAGAGKRPGTGAGRGAAVRRAAGALFGRRARLRWVHLVLGGALLMPYWMLSAVVLGSLDQRNGPLRQLLLHFAALGLSLPMAAVTALVPIARALEGAAARALCTPARPDEVVTGPARSWAARRRTAAWYVLHVLFGGVVSGMTLAGAPFAMVLLFSPTGLEELVRFWEDRGFPGWLPGPLTGLALLALIVSTSAGLGALLARWAPVLLGPTPDERVAAAERRATVLAQRNRLARELHDSVGHALSAVGIQASAAARVLRTDPDFAAEALAAIEETARGAVAELDAVLGLLREEDSAEAGPAGPTLAGLDDLLRQLARTGLTVDAELSPGLDRLPAAFSREAYRIVQEGLTNVLRHAGPAPARLRVGPVGGRLEIELTNPVGPARPSRPGGGRGLRGIGERAAALRGGCEAGPADDGTTWRLAVWLPAGGER
ncbi:sensor histidine kinase [Streptomyces sp. BE303]|uniref:sensor histidine kinase n=1 Tax=Streptomyces sp. BE303 TaxID=3002528 RepID=UPI002E766E1C|nr:histidine kinase [Streptomyces sp. BE303]MED7948296.1 histidine kinase [Streptomyces sp. BE303]